MPPLDQSRLLALAQKCHDQIVAIEAANTRIIERGRAHLDGPWGRMLNETYDPICRSCHEHRRDNGPADAFLDVICPDTDLKAVCDRKWELGETLETYRKRLNEFVPPPAEHDELELLIRRSVTQVDRSPIELDRAVKHAIAAARPVIEVSPAAMPTPTNSHEAIHDVVVMVHGIRDFALWQATIGPTLRQAGFAAEPTNYGRFSLVKFLAPVPFFRRWAINEVWEQIRIVKQQYPGARMSFIAHSFGTYVVAHLIKRNFDLGAHRIIFCGSVVSHRFRFQDYQGRFAGSILNEVGTQDIWPAMAQSMTWGYGSAGTYGFRRPLVHDRWHNGAGHGYFLKPDFCKTFWIPYLKSGTIAAADHNPESPRLWVRLASVFKIKYLLLIAIACLIYFTGGTDLLKNAVESQQGRRLDANIAACFANPGGYATWPVAFSSQPPGARVRVAQLLQTERDPWLERQDGVEHLAEATPACAILSQNRYRAVFELNGERQFQDFIVTGPQVVVAAKFKIQDAARQ
jgi:hypothetical protein